MGLKGAFGGVFGRASDVANGLMLKAAYVLAGKWIKAAAEGKHGAQAQALYLWLLGKKTATGAVFTVIALVCAAIDASSVATWVSGSLAGVLVGAGLLDKAWRDDTAWRSSLREIPLYRWLVEHSAETTLVFSTAWAFEQAGYCWHWDCAVVAKVLLGLAAAAVYLGLADATWKADPPLILPPAKKEQ